MDTGLDGLPPRPFGVCGGGIFFKNFVVFKKWKEVDWRLPAKRIWFLRFWLYMLLCFALP